MPRVTITQTNFTAGEISPRMHGRMDVARMQSACKTLRNAYPTVQGGALMRWGFRHLGAAKRPDKRARLIPFVFSAAQAYALEFGDGYLRVWKRSGQVLALAVPFEIATPYTEAQLGGIDFTQSADTVVLFHKTVPTQKLVRLADDNWTLGPLAFDQEPTDEVDPTPSRTCTPSAKEPEGQAITLTLDAAGWAVGDVGKLVRINGGLCKITGYTTDTVVDAKIVRVLNATAAAQPDSWELQAPMFGGARGYPSTGTFHDQRLVMAGAPGYPSRVVGSRPGYPFDFTASTADDDAFTFDISADQMNPIKYLSSMRTLVALGFGGEFTIQGGIEKPLTPTNVQTRQRSNHGAADVRPVRIGREEIFVQRGGRKVLALSYSVANDDYESGDLTTLADHLAKVGVVDMCWQQEPDRLLWVVLADGRLASLTLERQQDVLGWAQHVTDGFVESVCSIPGETADEVFAIVRRTVNGQTVRYIERMEAGLYVDSGVTGEQPAGAAVWSGLDHLEGRTVTVNADGVAQGTYTVSGGAITLTRPAKVVQIGLPFSVHIEMLEPEIQTGTGTSTGNAQRTSEATLRVLNTAQAKVNGQTVTFRKLGTSLLDQPVPDFSGIKSIPLLGFDHGASPLTIVHDTPLPFHLLSVTRKFTVND